MSSSAELSHLPQRRRQLQRRDCYSEHRCSATSRIKLSILQRGRHEKEFARAKIYIGAAARAGQATNNGELSRWRNFAWRIEIPFLELEKLVVNKQFALRLD